MISVGSVLDLFVPSANALSAWLAAASAWDLPAIGVEEDDVPSERCEV